MFSDAYHAVLKGVQNKTTKLRMSCCFSTAIIIHVHDSGFIINYQTIPPPPPPPPHKTTKNILLKSYFGVGIRVMIRVKNMLINILVF